MYLQRRVSKVAENWKRTLNASSDQTVPDSNHNFSKLILIYIVVAWLFLDNMKHSGTVFMCFLNPTNKSEIYLPEVYFYLPPYKVFYLLVVI